MVNYTTWTYGIVFSYRTFFQYFMTKVLHIFLCRHFGKEPSTYLDPFFFVIWRVGSGSNRSHAHSLRLDPPTPRPSLPKILGLSHGPSKLIKKKARPFYLISEFYTRNSVIC